MINLTQLILLVFDGLYLLLLARVLMSWIPHNRYHPLIQMLYQITDPILSPFQQIFPRSIGIDFSPIVAFMFLGILKNILLRIF
jgi:YggT family protein